MWVVGKTIIAKHSKNHNSKHLVTEMVPVSSLPIEIRALIWWISAGWTRLRGEGGNGVKSCSWWMARRIYMYM